MSWEAVLYKAASGPLNTAGLPGAHLCIGFLVEAQLHEPEGALIEVLDLLVAGVAGHRVLPLAHHGIG